MAGLWYRTGSVAVTQSSKKITGTGTSWLTALNRPSKGNVFYGPDGKAYEIDYISSETELYLVDAYAGADSSGQSYKIDVRGGTVPELSRQLSEHYAYMQGIIDSLQSIVSGSGDVTITGPSGQTVTVPALTNMLSKSGNLAGLAAPDTALNNLGLTAVGKAVAKAIDAAAARIAIGAYPSTGGALNGALRVNAGQGKIPGAFIGAQDKSYKAAIGVSASNTEALFGLSTDAASFNGFIRVGSQLKFNPDGGAAEYGVFHRGDKPTAADVGAYSKTEMPYETGSFTPTVQGGTTAGATTYGTRYGNYTRVGNRVFFELYVTWTAATGTGDLLIGGFPFVNAAASPGQFTVIPEFLTFSGQIGAGMSSGGSVATLMSIASGVTWSAVKMDSAAGIRMSGVYQKA